jgi:hypothetical protein
MRTILLLLASAVALFAQNPPGGIPNVTTLPASCRVATPPNIVFLTTGTVGPYYCSSPNTWTFLGGSSGLGAVVTLNITAASSGTFSTVTPGTFSGVCYDTSGNPYPALSVDPPGSTTPTVSFSAVVTVTCSALLLNGGGGIGFSPSPAATSGTVNCGTGTGTYGFGLLGSTTCPITILGSSTGKTALTSANASATNYSVVLPVPGGAGDNLCLQTLANCGGNPITGATTDCIVTAASATTLQTNTNCPTTDSMGHLGILSSSMYPFVVGSTTTGNLFYVDSGGNAHVTSDLHVGGGFLLGNLGLDGGAVANVGYVGISYGLGLFSTGNATYRGDATLGTDLGADFAVQAKSGSTVAFEVATSGGTSLFSITPAGVATLPGTLVYNGNSPPTNSVVCFKAGGVLGWASNTAGVIGTTCN